MSQSLEELGPVDWLVIEFRGGSLDSGVSAAIVDLVERGIIRVLDLVVVRKDEGGCLHFVEVTDLARDELGDFAQLRSLARLLSTDDLVAMSQAVVPGSTAACLVWENTWAVGLASSVRRHDGQIAALGHVPVRALLESIEADIAAHGLDRTGEAPARDRERVTCASIVGPVPVARAAFSAATAAVVAHGINRRLAFPEEGSS